jgi:large subunit ribosomal protein L18
MRTLSRRLARRKKRVSYNIVGTGDMPRISISRSNRYIFVQAIDDNASATVASIHTKNYEANGNKSKSDSSFEAGRDLAQKLKSLGISKAIIDRGRFHYQGRVKRFVEGLRDSGMKI